MAVEALVSVIIQKLADMLEEEKSVARDKVIVQQLIKEIIKSLNKFKTGGYLTDAEDKPDSKTDDWAKKYLGYLHELEDEIEKFAIRIARQSRRKRLLIFNQLNACQKVRRKMKKIRSKINKTRRHGTRGERVRTIPSSQHTQRSISYPHENDVVEETNSDAADSETVESPSPLKASTSRISAVAPNQFCRCSSAATQYEERVKHAKLLSGSSFKNDEMGIVGFKKDVNTLASRLLSGDGDPLVPIVGVEGSGKTTLARVIYKRREIKQHFQCRAWVFVTKELTKENLLLSLLKQVGNFEDQGDSTRYEDLLKGKLVQQRCLVVLDNVDGEWGRLEDAFPKTSHGSRIVFTTRDAGVAGHHHNLTKLSEEDSWKMFLNKAGWEEISPSNPDNSPKQEILNICNGLPLNIVLLGGLFSTDERRSSKEGWDELLSSLQDWCTSNIMWLSYKDLPVHSKICLLYLLLFPRDRDISVRRLLRLWLAEGFVERSQSPKFPEDTLQEYFDDLVRRNLIQISKLRSDGSPRRCRLLDVLHDYLLPKAKAFRLFYAHRGPDCCKVDASLLRRMVEYVDIQNKYNPSQLAGLRSYLSFNSQKKDLPAKEVGKFVSNIIGNGFGLLRVLDLEGVYKPSLPDKLGDLFNLRYLGLRWTFLDTLPASVCDLPYLETLDVKHTYINSLSSSIWKLKHLRNLNLNYGTRIDMPMRWRSSPTLLTLWGLYVDHKSPVKDGLNRLCDLRELGITFDLSFDDQEDFINWIASLTALRSLRMRSKDDRGRPSELRLMPLKRLEKLSHLNLMGSLQSLPCDNEFPPNLKVLTLSVSMLQNDPMPTLGQLKSLTVLRLFANSYCGDKMVCPQEGFGELRVLKLWMLKGLVKWEVEEGAMARLKKLDIRCCYKLESIPQRLLKGSLEDLILTDMPKEFTADVQQKCNCPSITVNEGEAWEFTPLPWEQDDTVSCVNGERVNDGPFLPSVAE